VRAELEVAFAAENDLSIEFIDAARERHRSLVKMSANGKLARVIKFHPANNARSLYSGGPLTASPPGEQERRIS
jgi:hypothetical protein